MTSHYVRGTFIFTTPNLTDRLTALVRAGAPVLQKPVFSPIFDTRVAIVADPDGNRIRLIASDE